MSVSQPGKFMTDNQPLHVRVIAEAGVNHNGSLIAAKKLADAAAAAKTDFVKFQTFDPKALVVGSAATADYQRAGGYESQLDMLSRLTLSREEQAELKDYCESIGIAFLSTAFDLDSVRLLQDLGQKIWKIPSGEITNVPLIEMIGSIADQVILSTGMATLGEIEAALMWLKGAGFPRDRVTVLHCNTEYPTPYHDVHLRAMQTIGHAFNVRVGYSDHTMGIEVPIAAVALGATVIEKHFTLDRTLPGPDQKASLEPDELSAMVAAIRNIEQALGTPEKRVTDSERVNRAIARKSIYASQPINVGEAFTESNLTTKRPDLGVPADRWPELIGKTARKAYHVDDPIESD
jgi:N,N'-diacetyllegionaminate synthase